MASNIDYEYIKKELAKMNISFDIQTIHDDYIGSLCDTKPRLHIPAAAAIICESKKIPTVGNTGFTTSGTKVENIMRHLIDGVSKEQYLETIKVQIRKWNQPSHFLAQKVNKLSISFRIFKKYKSIFQQLSHKSKLQSSNMSDHLSFYWLVFLLLKFQKGITEDINESTKALSIIIKAAFTNYIGNLSNQQVQECISKSANFPCIPRISEAEKNQTVLTMCNIINSVFWNRSPFGFFADTFKNDPKFLIRIVDDLSDQYQLEYQNHSEGHPIDEMTFLELSKDLTPQVHRAYANQNSHKISKVLSFNDQDDMSEEHSPSFVECSPTERKIPTFGEIPQFSQFSGEISKKLTFESNQQIQPNIKLPVSPVSLIMAKQTWANARVEDYNEAKLEEFRAYLTLKGIDYRHFEEECQQKVNRQVNQFSQKFNAFKDKQKNETIKLFCSLALQIVSSSSEDQNPLKQRANFIELLCLAGVMYSIVSKKQNINFKKYCEIYQIKILDAVKMLQFMGQKFNSLDHIKKELLELEKQVLIQEIWESAEGYNLIFNLEEPGNKAIINRLFRHINERINEICRKIQIQMIMSHRVYQMVKDIIQSKKQLLEKNKLDQIIICSITASLDFNKAKHSQALGTIFYHYNTTQFSFNQNSEGLYCRDGNKMSLMDFYNNVFLLQIEDIQKDSKYKQMVLTPLRQQYIDQKFTGSIPPISKYQNIPKPFGGLQSSKKYQQSKLKKISSHRRQELEPRQQQEQSPRFNNSPHLYRTYSFGRSP